MSRRTRLLLNFLGLACWAAVPLLEKQGYHFIPVLLLWTLGTYLALVPGGVEGH